MNFEKRIPTSVDEAMIELDRRIMIAYSELQASGNLTENVNLRKIVYDLLKDFEQGLIAKDKGIIIKPS